MAILIGNGFSGTARHARGPAACVGSNSGLLGNGVMGGMAVMGAAAGSGHEGDSRDGTAGRQVRSWPCRWHQVVCCSAAGTVAVRGWRCRYHADGSGSVGRSGRGHQSDPGGVSRALGLGPVRGRIWVQGRRWATVAGDAGCSRRSPRVGTVIAGMAVQSGEMVGRGGDGGWWSRSGLSGRHGRDDRAGRYRRRWWR